MNYANSFTKMFHERIIFYAKLFPERKMYSFLMFPERVFIFTQSRQGSLPALILDGH